LRKRVFSDRLKWPVYVSPQGLETDQFDLPETIYILALNTAREVIGSWRILPTTGPTMVRDIWPEFLETLPMSEQDNIWEASRFAVDHADPGDQARINQINVATAELFCGLTELCIHWGISEIFTLYDMGIARLLTRLNCAPVEISQRLKIDGNLAQVGRFITNAEMLGRLRLATGVRESLIKHHDLPPAPLLAAESSHLREREHIYA
jgi:N-acyl-L-homoserine lactone synthetase